MNRKEQVFEIIRAKPGLTDVELHCELAQHSWAVLRLGRWVSFGPTYGSLYVALEELARDGLIDINRGEVTSEKRARRPPLRFYPRTRSMHSNADAGPEVAEHELKEGFRSEQQPGLG